MRERPCVEFAKAWEVRRVGTRLGPFIELGRRGFCNPNLEALVPSGPNL